MGDAIDTTGSLPSRAADDEALELLAATEVIHAALLGDGDVDGIVCGVCGSGDDATTLLLCDECNAGCHLACCSPPLARAPPASADWSAETPATSPRGDEAERAQASCAEGWCE